MSEYHPGFRGRISPSRNWKRFKEWRIDPYRRRSTPYETFTLVLTCFVVLVGVLQYLVYRRQTKIMASDNPQTTKLIEAANINACAAKKSAQAASDFATAAQSISDGVSDAVDKLDTQAANLGKLAGETNEANKSNALNNRPWIGPLRTNLNHDTTRIRIHPPGVQGPQLEFSGALVTLVNGGKTTATRVNIDLEWFQGVPLFKENTAGEGVGGLEPSDGVEIPHNPACDKGPLKGGSLLMLPGIPSDVNVVVPRELRLISRDIYSNRVGLYLVGCIDYSDALGKEWYRTNVAESYMGVDGAAELVVMTTEGNGEMINPAKR